MTSQPILGIRVTRGTPAVTTVAVIGDGVKIWLLYVVMVCFPTILTPAGVRTTTH